MKDATCEVGQLRQHSFLASGPLFEKFAATPLGLQGAGTPQQMLKPSM